jgi:8-oxo-dGTP pyrophosphatase MutT (NUDIX family)
MAIQASSRLPMQQIFTRGRDEGSIDRDSKRGVASKRSGPCYECSMDIADALLRHQPTDAEEAKDLDTIRRFVEENPEPFDRGILKGHLTASAVIVDAAGDRVLLLHHRKLDRWLQPGGHGDPGEMTGEQVALREALEETGIEGLTLHPLAARPLDVDVHDIPARGAEPAHEHLDLRYLVLAPPGADPRRAEAESSDLRWFRWDELSELGLDSGLQRLLGKAKQWVER